MRWMVLGVLLLTVSSPAGCVRASSTSAGEGGARADLPSRDGPGDQRPGDEKITLNDRRPGDAPRKDRTWDLSAPVVLDVDSTSGMTGTSTTIFMPHTTGSGANRLMLVGICGVSGAVAPATPTVTYGGIPLSQVGAASTGSTRVALFQLVAPPSGKHDVVFAGLNYLFNGGIMGIVTWTGVNQTSPLGPPVTGGGGGGTVASLNVPSGPDEIALETTCSDSPDPMVLGAGQVPLWGSPSGTARGVASTKAGAAPTVSMSRGLAVNRNWAMLGVSLRPSP